MTTPEQVQARMVEVRNHVLGLLRKSLEHHKARLADIADSPRERILILKTSEHCYLGRDSETSAWRVTSAANAYDFDGKGMEDAGFRYLLRFGSDGAGNRHQVQELGAALRESIADLERSIASIKKTEG